MNYQKHYNTLVNRSPKLRPKDVYLERHHIIPKCIEGTDDPSNLVYLKPEEHFVAHQLLVKIYPNNSKLVFALNRMTHGTKQHQNRNNNKSFGWHKKRLSIAVSEQMKGKHYNLGRKHKPESNEKNRLWHKNKQAWTILSWGDVNKIRQDFNNMVNVENMENLGKNGKNGRPISYKSLFTKHYAKIYTTISEAGLSRIVENKSWKI